MALCQNRWEPRSQWEFSLKACLGTSVEHVPRLWFLCSAETQVCPPLEALFVRYYAVVRVPCQVLSMAFPSWTVIQMVLIHVTVEEFLPFLIWSLKNQALNSVGLLDICNFGVAFFFFPFYFLLFCHDCWGLPSVGQTELQSENQVETRAMSRHYLLGACGLGWSLRALLHLLRNPCGNPRS